MSEFIIGRLFIAWLGIGAVGGGSALVYLAWAGPSRCETAAKRIGTVGVVSEEYYP